MGDSPAKKVRGAMTPYACFTKHFCNQVFIPGGQKNLAEISKMASERWKGMSDEEKKPYKGLAEADKARYDHQMAQLPAGSAIHSRKSKGLKRLATKKVKDPNAPKRATTAFFYFAMEERPKLRAANPDVKVTEISRELGKMWGTMDDEAKLKFQTMAEKDRQRYQAEMAMYEANLQNEGNENEVVSEED